ncbi:PKD domain-containing protein [Candidatus Bipolaricaulota bacterium]|nr:PKD domain-containing protein [Candidatus Bipolaricaulota bacterium]
MRKLVAPALIFTCLIIFSIYPVLSEEPPWPMYANNYRGTSYSPRTPIPNPWIEPVANEDALKRELGLEEITMISGSSGSFLLIGPDGILLFPISSYRKTEKGGSIGGEVRYLVAYDPEGKIEPWYRPIASSFSPGRGHVPAISPNGTVYTYSEAGELIGINIRSGKIVWKPKCEEIFPPTWSAFCRMDQQLGLSTLGSILISDSGDLVTNYKSLPIHLNSNHELKGIWLESLKGGQGAAYYPSSARALDRSGNFYVFSAQWEKKSSNTSIPLDSIVIALSPNFEEKWRSEIPGLKHGPTTSDVRLVVGQNKVFVYAANEGRTAIVTCLDRSTGEVKWQLNLPCISAGYSRPALSLPVLAPDPLSSLYVTHTTYEGFKLSSINIEDGSLNWQQTLSESFDPQDSYQMVMANETIYVEIDRGLLQVAASSGDISPCVIPAYEIKSMAVNEQGILYLVGNTGITRTTTNSKPIISSFEADIERYEERRNKVWVDYRVELKDPLGWNRNLIETITYGDGDRREDEIYVHRSEVGERKSERIEVREWGHSYNLEDLTDMEDGLTRPNYKVSVKGCEECTASKTTEVCLGAPKISKISVLPDDNVYVGEEVDFKGRAQSPICGNSELTYTWDFDDYSEKMRGSMVKHSFDRTGEFAVDLTVGIKGSPITTRVTRVINVSKTPGVDIERTPIRYTKDGLEYRFDFTFRGDLIEGKQPPEVRWNFGDGETAITPGGEGTVHTFDSTGVYNVKATATLAEGVVLQGEKLVDYTELPEMIINMSSKSPHNEEKFEVICQHKNPGNVVDGLSFSWYQDDIPVAVSGMGNINNNRIPDLEYTKPGSHSITCVVEDPNPNSELVRETSKDFKVRAFPFPEPNGYSIPFLQEPDIPSGADCRGACGGNCPVTCTDSSDIQLVIEYPDNSDNYYLVTYEDVKNCGTHAGCRWHDWCFDRCVEVYGETDVKMGRCHTVCNARAEYYATVETFGINGPLSVLSAWNWKEGEGPYDSYWKFTGDITLRELDNEELSSNDFPVYPEDFSEDFFGTATYEIVFYTGHKLGAGTDARINLELRGELYGKSTSSGLLTFDAAKLPDDSLGYLSDDTIVRDIFDLVGVDDYVDTAASVGNFVMDNQVFESGSIDSFFITGYEVGDLTEVIVGHDNSGSFPDWYLDKVVVVDTRSRRNWMVNVARWLNEDNATLSVNTSDIHEESVCFGSTIYYVKVRTKLDLGAGTDSDISLELTGKCGAVDTSSGTLVLDNFNNNFEMGSIDKFFIPGEEIGELTSVKLHHDGSGIGSTWKPDYIEITNLIGDRTWRIEIEEELDNETKTFRPSPE